MRLLRKLSLLAALVVAFPVLATDLNCRATTNVEEFRYSWRLRGGLRWIAGLVFPTSGVGNLKTTYPNGQNASISSELLITAPEGGKGGFFAYESEMELGGRKTLMTYSGYRWGSKSRKERAFFDYVKRLVRIHKETPGKVEDKVKPIPDDDLRDVLTAIYFLRQNAPRITGPVTTSIYSEGKEYPVVFRPAGKQVFVIEDKRIASTAYEIVDAPGGRKWPGGVKVWLSDDERRIPFRIEIRQSMASLQLDLKSIEACAFMQAAK
jgi:hypothetical protein